MMLLEQDTRALSADTEAILLLCGRFGNGNTAQSHHPLSQKEYERLTRWLIDRKLRPSDLLTQDARSIFAELIGAKLDQSRIEVLLTRGTALALAVEKWQRNGLWVLSRSDADYPKRLKKRLGHSAPPLLYGAGDTALLEQGGVAIVGSRDATEDALEFTRSVASACAKDGLGLISGGAKGVDSAAMQGAGEAGGTVVGVLANDLLRASVNRQNREGIQDQRLVLVSPFNPEAGFNAGNAMARNRYIYSLADYALVIDAAANEGGTWNGAVENLREGWVPLHVRVPGDKAGNAALIQKGAHTFGFPVSSGESIRDYFSEASADSGASGAAVNSESADLFAQSTASVPLVADPPLAPYQTPHLDVCAAAVVPETHAGMVNDDSGSIPELPESVGSASQDMFADFLRKLPRILADTAKTPDEIQVALGLEKGQVKAWLGVACERGVVEKHGKPTSYSLRRQTTLC